MAARKKSTVKAKTSPARNNAGQARAGKARRKSSADKLFKALKRKSSGSARPRPRPGVRDGDDA